MVLLQKYELENLIRQLLKSQIMSTKLLAIINVILLKVYPRYPQFKFIDVNDLLQWNLWPNVLVTFGMYNIMYVRASAVR